MTSIFKRKGRKGYTLKYKDATGRPRFKSFRTRALAEQKALDFRIAPDPGRTVLFKDYGQAWLKRMKANVRPGTHDVYGSVMNQLVGVFGQTPVDKITKAAVKDFVAERIEAGRSRGYVRYMRAVLHSCLEEAREDGLLYINPAVAPPRGRDGGGARQHRPAKAFDADQLGRFLAAAAEHEPGWWALFRIMALAGLRLGEAIALRWEDFDADGRQLRVERGYTRGRVQRPKSGRTRSVALPAALVADLEALHARRRRDALKEGHELSPWLWTSPRGDHPPDEWLAQKAFGRARGKAGLPPHHTPHSLRHTYASLLLSAGAPIQYVQRQLGHASISLTADVYGSWLPLGEHASIEDLAALVTLPVTKTVPKSPKQSNHVRKTGHR